MVITIKDISISATAGKKKDAKNIAYKNMAIRLEDKYNKGRCQKKTRENVGIFPKWGTPPPPCLGMTRLFEKKNHGLFCILGGGLPC